VSRAAHLCLAASLAGAVLAAAARADAHARSVSYASWSLAARGGSVQVQVALLDVSALQGAGEIGVPAAAARAARSPDLGAHLRRRVQLFAESGPCAGSRGSFHWLPAPIGWTRAAWSVRCAGAPHRVRSDLLFDIVPSHAQLVGVKLADGGSEKEHVLTPAEREAPIGADRDAGVLRFVRLGVEHILTGWDHLAFLLALLLFAGSWRGVAVVVTGFTLGHSATLALGALGIAQPEPSAVEVAIALSVGIVAVENVWLAEGRCGTALPLAAVCAVAAAAAALAAAGRGPALATLGFALFAACYFGLLGRAKQPERLRWAAASLFGLLHGLGFAGALREMDLSEERLVAALLGFNGGVEVAQLALVSVAWPALSWLRRRRASLYLGLVRWGSAAVLSAGVFWFTTRAAGG
jgi:hypothetical protein